MDKPSDMMGRPRPVVEPGWVQVGKVCPDGRRSLWVRISRKQGWKATLGTGEVIEDKGDAYQIEMCAGREGMDGYVSFYRGSTATPDELVRFNNLEDVLSSAVWVHELLEEKKEYERAMAEDEKRNLNTELTATSAIASALNAVPADKRGAVLAAACALVDNCKSLIEAADMVRPRTSFTLPPPHPLYRSPGT